MSENPQCHIHEEVGSWKSKIREKICVREDEHPLTKHVDGKYYCLFHLPNKDKNKNREFEKIFQARLNAVEAEIAEKKKLPKEEWKAAKKEISYDFRFVWFPSTINLAQYEFDAATYFRLATFAADVNFKGAKFSSTANFVGVKFSSHANFSGATFSSVAHFKSAIFSTSADFSKVIFLADANFAETKFKQVADFIEAQFSARADFWATDFSAEALFYLTTFVSDVDFGLATFSADAFFYSAIFVLDADFNLATFSADTFFNWTTFGGDVFFTSVKFEPGSQTYFEQTLFTSVADFSNGVSKGYLHFEGGQDDFFIGEWLDEGKTRPKKEKRETKVFEYDLDLGYFRAEKPENVTFNKVRLRPNWFVNVDARKFVFTDIYWENHDAKKSDLEKELESLTQKGYEEDGKTDHKYRLLIIAFRNLATNAEEFNRFGEASTFRKSASECERLLRKENIRTWWSEPIRGSKVHTKFWKKLKTIPIDLVHFSYRSTSSYGEGSLKAFRWLIGIVLVSAILYSIPLAQFADAGNLRCLEFFEAIPYSLRVMVLQRPEPFPANWFAKWIVALESVLAPLQAALLALAIRRKFMR